MASNGYKQRQILVTHDLYHFTRIWQRTKHWNRMPDSTNDCLKWKTTLIQMRKEDPLVTTDTFGKFKINEIETKREQNLPSVSINWIVYKSPLGIPHHQAYRLVTETGPVHLEESKSSFPELLIFFFLFSNMQIKRIEKIYNWNFYFTLVYSLL